MKATKHTDDTLIIQSSSGHRFILSVLLFLTTPFWIWIASAFDDLVIMAGAIILPFAVLQHAWKTYTNWQLVFEGDYGTGAVYQGRWGKRQVAHSFELNTLESAKIVTDRHHYRTKYWQRRTKHVHHLAIKFMNQHTPLKVGIGSHNAIYRQVDQINAWLKAHRA